jgi:hypothetical protein
VRLKPAMLDSFHFKIPPVSSIPLIPISDTDFGFQISDFGFEIMTVRLSIFENAAKLICCEVLTQN